MAKKVGTIVSKKAEDKKVESKKVVAIKTVANQVVGVRFQRNSKGEVKAVVSNVYVSLFNDNGKVGYVNDYKLAEGAYAKDLEGREFKENRGQDDLKHAIVFLEKKYCLSQRSWTLIEKLLNENIPLMTKAEAKAVAEQAKAEQAKAEAKPKTSVVKRNKKTA